MIETQAATSQTTTDSPAERLFMVFAISYQAFAVLVLLIAPIFALNWFRTPFIGALLENTMIVNGIHFDTADNWSAHSLIPNLAGQQLISIDAKSVDTPSELQSLLQSYEPGQLISVETRNLVNGQILAAQIELQSFSLRDQVTLFFIPYGLGVIFLILGFWVFRLRRSRPAGKAFVLFAASSAVMLATLFDTWTTNQLTPVWMLSLLLLSAGMFVLALVFPRPFAIVDRWPGLRWLPFLIALFIGAAYLPSIYDLQDPRVYKVGWFLALAFGSAATVIFILNSIVQRFRSFSPVVREQSRLIFLGSMVAFMPIGIWFAGRAINLDISFSPVLLLPVALFPLSTAYAMLRYRFASTDYLVNRGILYSALTVLSVAFYILIVWGLNLLLGEAVSADSPLLVGLMIFVVAALFNPLRDRLQHSVDTLFFRGRVVFQEQLQAFSQELTQVTSLDEILHLVVRYISPLLKANRIHIFLLDTLSDQFYAVSNIDGLQHSDLRFSNDSVFVRYLEREQSPVLLREDVPLPVELNAERARLSLVSAQLFVPMIGRKQLVGWIALGTRATGESYGLMALSYLDSLGDQTALAVERAQVIVDLQRRVHEMNVLGRVAQGINITLNFDDILELIYTQTVQVVPSDHFRITLVDEITDTCRHVFYLDSGERFSERENRIVPKGLGLEQEVIRSSRAIATDDYDSECRRRSVIPDHQDVYAWLGVPLSAGTRTIGALSLSSRNAADVYTAEQITIIQSIADQAAGAITKTQLLEESERRTRQLETLNQVARSLTLQLELEPLLNRILESAVEIFNCEAGTLFLVEDDTGEIVFSVVVGGAEELVGTRLAPGTGLVGKCVDSGRPIIQNNVQASKDWFGETDEKTGFTTRSLLVVPMQVRDELMGVIELINKLDQTPFTPDDERLLMAFSAQAAVAVQNARLFTLTDQALSDRVDELSVMQRIDRELNTSLDLARAMRITLAWAMRQSQADAGLVGVLEDGKLKLTDLEGYPLTTINEENHHRILQLKLIQDALIQTQPRAILKMEEPEGLLPGSSSQVAVPILREGQTIGVLLLESLEAFKFSSETMGFLNRLSDHAAIAISNASLYSELQEANIAKSDFISFVSHELKTPMTSIKGYADLLAQGAVGEINEAQAGFLSTIRSNVNRMATLVSDLADISRIEAGRLRLDFSPVSIREVIDEVVRSSAREVDAKALSLVLEVEENLPPVWGDRIRLVQVLANLLSNAVKYTPEEGEVVIRAQIDQTENETNLTGLVTVVVTDSGIGIRPDEQQYIFTKFFRSEDLKAREVPGTGLGLNITKNLIELQGGNIRFESAYRQGTTFSFTIPVAETS